MTIRDRPAFDLYDKLKDSVGNLRTTGNSTSLHNSILTQEDRPDVFDVKLTGGGLFTHEDPGDFNALRVQNSGDAVLVQTRHYHTYQSGRSMKIAIRFAMGQPVAGLTQRVGYYDDNDGAFYTKIDNESFLVIRTSTSGSPVNIVEVPRSQWNRDKLDGKGPSGEILDDTKSQILVMDVGDGRVRFGFSLGGHVAYCHEESFSNRAISTEWSATVNLPLRFEIISTTTIDRTLRQFASSIEMEGGYDVASRDRAFCDTTLNLPASTRVPLISLRLNSASIRKNARIIEYHIATIAQTSVAAEIVKNGTLTNASFADYSDTYMQVDTFATVITGGVVISCASSGRNAGSAMDDVFTNDLGASIDGVSDIFTLVGTSRLMSDVYAGMNWRELL